MTLQRICTAFTLVLVCALNLTSTLRAQPMDRVPFNGQELFLSGGNIAWVSFARDIGPGFTNLSQFEDIFQELHANGGNALRFWLHTNGVNTPERSGSTVTGPGAGTIDDLRAILDLAWENEIGLMLNLWSHDMLRRSFGAALTDRNKALLQDPDILQSYIDNALVPMVEALRGHPAILAWEIFNEPEGMSVEHGWQAWDEVPMADIQRAINRMAGAIRRADPNVVVTNGAVGMSTTTDANPGKTTTRVRAEDLSRAEREHLRRHLTQKYDHPFSQAEANAYHNSIVSVNNFNYYTDDRLIAAGGDPDGTLDYYTVHYYDWAGTSLSPFHNPFSVWNLDKPLVVAEFFLPDVTFGVAWEDLYATLYDGGYAGALGWQWFDISRPELAENWPRILRNTQALFDAHQADVDIVQPGPHVLTFSADPPLLEAGIETMTTLTWDVIQATTVTLNGQPVSSSDTQTVMLTETTTFELIALDDTGLSDTMQVEVKVLSSLEINRALQRPAFVSASETCCNNEEPWRTFDGNPGTRWSSPYTDNHWIYVDLGAAFDISRIVLNWEVAYGSDYDLQVSYDAQTWTTVVPVRGGDGGLDEHILAVAVPGRYVRMQGLTRGTQFGFSLWEMEVYGIRSAQQPPSVVLTSPTLADEIDPGQSITLTAEATDPDGSITSVSFYQDSTLLSTVHTAPYTFIINNAREGAYTFFAEATDNDGLTVRTPLITIDVFVHPDRSRYETEAAQLSEGISTQTTDTAASGGSHVSVNRAGSTILWSDVTTRAGGHYVLTLAYRLPLGSSTQHLMVNGTSYGNLSLNQSGGWQTVTVPVVLQVGANTVQLEAVGGWVYIDYLEIERNLAVATEEDTLPAGFRLYGNYPNPFNPMTTIPYSLPEASAVRLDVVDLTGRHVITLVDRVQPAGYYAVPFAGARLASGVYLYRLQAGNHVEVRRMMLIK